MMERSLGLLFLVAPFLLLSSLPGKHQVLALEVLGADSNADNGNQGKHGNQGNDGNQGNPENPDEDSMAMVIARNSKLSDAQNSQEAMMVIICANLQGNVTECADVTPFQEYFNNLPPRAPSDTQPTRRRRKRFSNWSGSANSNLNSNSGLNSNFFNDPWPASSFFNNNFNNNLNTHTGFSSNAVICPSQTDHSAVYSLNPDSSNYPATEIGNELNRVPVIRDCLIREIVLQNDPPTLQIEDFRLTANVTCPFAQLRLWQYQSQAAGGMCWIMQNVQENIVYRVCGEKFCRNCKDKSISGSGFGNLNQKLCITDYTRVSVWAYCPNLNPGSRIIRDRIIIPQSCSCQSIQCEAIPNWRK